jgi:hypothetical protein
MGTVKKGGRRTRRSRQSKRRTTRR